jgi:hypothetical protein
LSGVIGAALALLAAPASSESPAPQPPPVAIAIAIADFDYIDTSGESVDQTAKHQALLRAFAASVRHDLDLSGKYRVVALCSPEPCAIGHADPARLADAARGAGATLLLVGGIHKESTLVQWAKASVVDIGTERVIFDRLLTFRGDDDEAWRRAAAFLAADLKTRDFSE